MASGFASEQCFTLGAKTLPLNLVAESAADRTAWINGIKAVFSNGQAAKKAEKAAAAAAAAAAAGAANGNSNGNGNGATAEPVAAPVAAPAAAPVEAAPAAAAVAAPSSSAPAANLLAEGHVYRSIVLDSTAARGATASDIFVWHAPEDGKLGTLYWQPASANQSQNKTKDPERSMPVARIRDVMRAFTHAHTPQQQMTSGIEMRLLISFSVLFLFLCVLFLLSSLSLSFSGSSNRRVQD